MIKMKNEAWDGYPKGAIVKSVVTGVLVEITGPAERQVVRSVYKFERTYSSYAQAGRVIGSTDKKSAGLVSLVAEQNRKQGLPPDAVVMPLGQFVFYAGDEE